MSLKASLITLFVALVGLGVSAQVPMNGLSGWWSFDGNASDLSSAANHGTVNGATLTTDRFGIPGMAYHFDGDDHIAMLSAGPTGSVSRSVSFWSRSTNTSIQVAYGYGEAAFPGGIYQVVYNYNCTGIGFDNSQDAYIRGNTQIADGFWHHIAVVYDSGLGTQIGNIKIYVDTVLLTNLACSMGTASPIYSNNMYPITIGRSSNSLLRYFEGDLDDFFEYNRPLLYSEICQLYHDKKCTKPKPSSPGPIYGSGTVCLGSTHIFSVTPVLNATFYNWYIPGGWQGTSNSNTISLQANVAGGNISVAAGNGCGSSTFTTRYVNTSICTSLDETTAPDTYVFPNPTSGIIRVGNIPVGSEIRISNVVGQQLRTFISEAPEVTLDCTDFENGIYVITVYSGTAPVWTQKMLKN